MKSLKYLAASALLALGLVACGGGTNTLTGSTVPKVTSTAASISLATSALQIASNSNVTGTPALATTVTAPTSAQISAVVVDKSNNAVAGATVVFAASSGVVSCSVSPCVTNASGVVQATLSSGTDLTNRSITVTATAGATAGTGTVTVDVVGTSLSVTGVNQLSLGASTTYSLQLLDSNGAGIAGAVSISSALGNTVPTSVTTGANGKATFPVTASISGSDRLTVSALGATASAALNVSSTNFTVSASAATATIGTDVTITVTSLNGGAAVVGQTVTFSATRGTLSAASATTDANGVASVTSQSLTAGGGLVTATATAGGASAQATLTFLATTPTQIAVQASPAAVTTSGQSTITATLRDANNNLVANQPVNFSLVDVTGGTLAASQASTNSQGEATVVYTAGSTTSAAGGVTITAAVPGTSPSVTGQTTLTVGGQTVFLSLGTGNTVSAPDAATYALQFAVLALDSQGAAVPNASVTAQVLPVNYVKGARQFFATWVTVPSTPAACPNEDINFDGILQVGEDFNGNNRLDPGNVASVTPVSGTTNAAGELLLTVTYPKDHAGYVTVELIVTTAVKGTQSTNTSTFLLPGAASDFSTATINPPGMVSPFGQAATCNDPN